MAESHNPSPEAVPVLGLAEGQTGGSDLSP